MVPSSLLSLSYFGAAQTENKEHKNWDFENSLRVWTLKANSETEFFKNRLQGTNSARLCSLAGKFGNPVPTRFLAPIDYLKIPALDIISRDLNKCPLPSAHVLVIKKGSRFIKIREL
jgi:hypothetical protein